MEIGAGATLNHTVTTTSQTGIMGSTEGVVTLLGNATVNTTAGFSLSSNQINYGKGVDDGAGTFSFTKGGTGNLILGASVSSPAITGAVSTYGGTTTVDAGILRIGIADSLPDTALAVSLGATFDMSASGHNITNATFSQRVAGLNDGTGGGGTITGNRINTANSGSIGNRTLTVDGTSGTFAFSGVIENKPVGNGTANNVLSLTKSGDSTQTLSGASTYTGATTINDGTLLITGALSGSATTVNTDGILGGTGTVQTVNVLGGTLSPGTSIGTLNIGALSMADTSTLSIELGTVTGDQVNITGSATLAGTITLGLTLTADPVDNTVFTLFNGTATLNGYAGGARFAYLGNALDEGEAFTATTGLFTQDFTISYTADSGNDVVLTAVPEPGSAALLLGGLAMLASRRRRS